MKIGVLRCGPQHPVLAKTWGEYPEIYARMLHQVDPDIDVVGVDIVGGVQPDPGLRVDGWIISGSKHGVYEDHPWIPPLKAFLRDTVEAGTPVVGICFGHQILAEAMGGRAEKFSGGWGLGPMSYDMVRRPAWAERLGSRWTSNAIHQDQVVELPPTATLIAENPFCPHAALAYGDPDDPVAISVQPHPEFDRAFVGQLFDESLLHTIAADVLDPARERLDDPVDNLDWAHVIVGFFKNKNAGV